MFMTLAHGDTFFAIIVGGGCNLENYRLVFVSQLFRCLIKKV